MATATKICKCGVTHMIEANDSDIRAHKRNCFRCNAEITFKVKDAEELTVEESPKANPTKEQKQKPQKRKKR